MEPKKLFIQLLDESENAIKRRGQSPRKSAAFSAYLLAYLCWEGNGSAASSLDYRPIFATFAATEAGMNPFVANLRLGHAAAINDTPTAFAVRFNDKGRFLYTRETRDEFATTTIEAPDLFAQDMGMVDPRGITFVCLCPDWWLASAPGLTATECRATLAAIRGEIRDSYNEFYVRLKFVASSMLNLTDLELVEWSRVATRLAIFFDRRSSRPLLPDPAFHLRLLVNGFAAKKFSIPGDTRRDHLFVPTWNHCFGALYGEGFGNIGVRYVVGVHITHADADLLLSEAVRLHRAARGA